MGKTMRTEEVEGHGSLNRVDTFTASRALTQLEAAELLRRSEQRRGPGVYYMLVSSEGTPDITPDTTTASRALMQLKATGFGCK